METTFIPRYTDEILLGNVSAEDAALLRKKGYTMDEHGEVAMSMRFGDGIAYVPNGCGLVLRYSTLAEVAASEEMQRAIVTYCGRNAEREITQFHVALKYGKVGAYKYVLHHPTWIQQDNNDLKEVWTIMRDDEGHIAFDVFEEDYGRMEDAGLIDESDGSDFHQLKRNPTQEELAAMQAEYGILWTEWIAEYRYNERGYLVKVTE